ncbi:unnamed protein product [Penicillium salamii]|uniref:Formylmethionine deformylase-like protein n=1 Tax=Penicillium salamii TaxID=1612424 RepID=A0A9W4JXW9_9EURO|nr:unnamed protein product [Penicillium salamii]CAG8028640.1 unnamed protein product [Penicillium salamii]CAG8063557.1 unnamed protein product [Penicillium salamii]CAG8079439.1 unnamed protein product [Penicillium salamii]CAG8188067.1 unnamed protein product [Penicillium salamii]
MRTISLTDQPHPDSLTERSTSPRHIRATSEFARTREDDHSPAVWGLGWRSPTLMVGLFLCGLALSVGHHIYYKSYDNTLVESATQQTWTIRIGTGFAFLVKTLLVAAIGIAAVQQMWATLRKKSVNIRGIDAIFSVLSDPLAFLVPDMWICAKTLTLLAIVSWLIPLVALITPATLSVHLKTTPIATDMNVPTVRFTKDFWLNWAFYEGLGYIYGTSFIISRLFTTTSSSAAIIPLPPPLPNSSYTLEFWGPSYKCQGLSEVIAETKGITYTDASGNHYNSFQDVWHRYTINSSYDSTIYYSGSAPEVLNNTLLIATWQYSDDYIKKPTETSLVCKLWNTSYVLDVSFNNAIQTLVPVSTDLVAPCDWDSSTASFSGLSSKSESLGGYHITHLLFSSLIKGILLRGATGAHNGNATQLMQSGIFECAELSNSRRDYPQIKFTASPTCRNKTLGRALEDLSRNFTYSLLSLNAANTSVPVSVNSPKNFYSYDWTNLFAAYATALVVTFVCITIGFFALCSNGVPGKTSFSNFLRTTRNQDLDVLTTGYCLGSDHLPDELEKVRLRFGEIETPQPFKHAAFGFEESVIGLVKDEKYY